MKAMPPLVQPATFQPPPSAQRIRLGSMTSTIDVKGQGHGGLVKVELCRENGLWRGQKSRLYNQIAF